MGNQTYLTEHDGYAHWEFYFWPEPTHLHRIRDVTRS